MSTLWPTSCPSLKLWKREAVIVAAGQSKIHTCRTDDAGTCHTTSHNRYFVYGSYVAEFACMGSRRRLRRLGHG